MPKAVDPLERRADFIDASWKVIAAEGVEAATLRRIAAEADCTTGALTHYFPNRNALIIEVLRFANTQAADRMRQVADMASTPIACLERVLREALPLDTERLSEWRIWLAFWAGSMNDTTLAKENAQRYEEWRGFLVHLLSPLSDAPKLEADMLVAFIDGLGLHLARHTGRGKALMQEQKRCAATLERYLVRIEK